jgi:putative peptidoglycan lipid II flippase
LEVATTKKKIYFSAVTMASATMISRVLGLLRELLMALYFGASGVTDAFLVAYRIPNLLRDLFAEGAFSSAFVPNFVKVKNQSTDKARSLFWSCFIWLSLITGIISLLMIIFSTELTTLFAPEFAKDQNKLHLTAQMVKIMAPYLMSVSIAALFMGVLNSYGQFFLPALAPAAFNTAVILSMVFLTGILDKNNFSSIYAVAIGVLIGGVLQVVMQVHSLFKKSMAPTLKVSLFDHEVLYVFRQLIPGLVGFAATQINILVTTILATSTVVGAVSWLQYAFRLFQLPVGILSVSIGNTNLVHFAQAWKTKQIEQAQLVLKTSLNMTVFFMLPVMVFLLIESNLLVSLVFERGQFSSLDSSMTSKALTFYALALPFYGLHKILVPCFYTIDRHRIPMLASIFSILFNIIFCLLLVDQFGFSILALGTSLSIGLNCIILIGLFKRFFGFSLLSLLNASVMKFIIGLIIAGALMRAVSYFVDLASKLAFFTTNATLSRLLQLAWDGIIFFGSYALILLVWGELDLLKQFWGRIRKKFS